MRYRDRYPGRLLGEDEVDIQEFVNSLSGKNRLEAYALVDQESRNAKRLAKGKHRESKANYAGKLAGLGFVLLHPDASIRPAGITHEDFVLFKPFLQELVEKGEVAKEVLEF
jgi:hypothetical protein